jgi:predicted ABC-type ATPase
MSARFKVMMPILLNVKGYSGIRIHKGNTEVDSLGCLLCGTRKKSNMITESTLATRNLYAKIESAKKQGQRIYITITK